MTPTPLQRNENVLEAFDEKVNEIRRCTHWGDEEDGPIFEFGGRLRRGDEIFIATDWGNIKKFISSALATQRQEVLEECEKLIAEYPEKLMQIAPNGSLPFVIWEGKADENEKRVIYFQAVKDVKNLLTSLKQRP